MVEPGGRYSTRITEDFLRGTSVPTRNVVLRLLLYDFVTSQSDIRQEHQVALTRYVQPYLTGGFGVWVGGMASRAADADYNQRLANQRARAVARRIENMSSTSFRRSALAVASFGESRSIGSSENSEYYRSVLVVVTRLPRLQVASPPRARPLAFFHKFRIGSTAGLDLPLEAGMVGGRFDFVIDYDVRDRQAPPSSPALYMLNFLGAEISSNPAGFPVPGEGLTWNYFTVSNNRAPRDFAGNASIGSWSILRISESTRLNLFLRHPREEVVIDPFRMGRASSIIPNFSYSRILGPFELLGEVVTWRTRAARRETRAR